MENIKVRLTAPDGKVLFRFFTEYAHGLPDRVLRAVKSAESRCIEILGNECLPKLLENYVKSDDPRRFYKSKTLVFVLSAGRRQTREEELYFVREEFSADGRTLCAHESLFCINSMNGRISKR